MRTTDILDAREEPKGRWPSESAWIPVSQLKDRLGELPSKEVTIRVANSGPEASEAVEFLQKGGRLANLFEDFLWTTDQPNRRLWKPNEFLSRVASTLPLGSALDLGCGSGRDVNFLAEIGWKVVAIDLLPEAVEAGKRIELYRNYAHPIDWVVGDADTVGPARATRSDLILSLYFLDRPMLRRIASAMPKNGLLLVEAFTEIHAARFGRPTPARFVMSGELPQLAPRLQTLEYSEGWRESGRHTGRWLAAKL